MNNPIKWQGKKLPIWVFFPFIVIHITLFGLLSFVMAYYLDVPTLFLLVFGFIGIITYLAFYSSMYGVDQFRWIFINTALGIFGLSVELNLLLSLSEDDLAGFPWYRDIIPFTLYVLYTFWLRQCVLAAFGAKDDPEKEERVSYLYAATFLLVYLGLYFL